MSFWLPAIAIPLVAAVVLCWPLLRERRVLRGWGAVLLLLIPLATLYLYQGVGTPEGIDVQAVASQPETEEDIDVLLGDLRARLEANPDDLQGWLLLGRSYKTMQQHQAALDALRQAQRLAPNDPRVLVELAESMIFTSGSSDIGPDVRGMIAAALETDPLQQKGLWLAGIAEFQSGEYTAALDYWQRLKSQLDPASGVAQSVQQQIDAAQAALGTGAEAASAVTVEAAPAATVAAEPESGDDGDWPGFATTVTAPPEMTVPDGAVLFLIARDPAQPRPPLGAVRIPNPVFPLTVRIDDSNSMMPQRPISGVAGIEVLARLSLSGRANASEGDPESTPAMVAPASTRAIQLDLRPAP